MTEDFILTKFAEFCRANIFTYDDLNLFKKNPIIIEAERLWRSDANTDQNNLQPGDMLLSLLVKYAKLTNIFHDNEIEIFEDQVRNASPQELHKMAEISAITLQGLRGQDHHINDFVIQYFKDMFIIKQYEYVHYNQILLDYYNHKLGYESITEILGRKIAVLNAGVLAKSNIMQLMHHLYKIAFQYYVVLELDKIHATLGDAALLQQKINQYFFDHEQQKEILGLILEQNNNLGIIRKSITIGNRILADLNKSVLFFNKWVANTDLYSRCKLLFEIQKNIAAISGDELECRKRCLHMLINMLLHDLRIVSKTGYIFLPIDLFKTICLLKQLTNLCGGIHLQQIMKHRLWYEKQMADLLFASNIPLFLQYFKFLDLELEDKRLERIQPDAAYIRYYQENIDKYLLGLLTQLDSSRMVELEMTGVLTEQSLVYGLNEYSRKALCFSDRVSPIGITDNIENLGKYDNLKLSF